MMAHITPRTAFDLLKTAYDEWSEDKASRLAASLAYYTAFSVAPLLLISIAVAGLVFGDEAARGQVFGQLRGLLGDDGAEMIQTAVANSAQKGSGTFATIVGLATLLWSASNVFGQLQEALNTIWEVAPNPNAGILATIKKRFFSMTMVLGIGFMLLVSLVVTAALGAVGAFFNNLLPGGAIVWQILNFVISFAVVAALFAAIYKVLPDATIKWSDVWVGAVFTALLFTVGKLLIGLYLGHASVGSTFGAAGSLLVFLVWVYYSSQILFFGAEFTQVYARLYGSRIVPTEDAIALSEVARADQGMPHSSAVEQVAAAQGKSSGEKGSSEKVSDAKPATDKAGGRKSEGREKSATATGRRADGQGANGQARAASGGANGRHAADGQHAATGSATRVRREAPLAALSKWNKKANRVGENGQKQPNRPERKTDAAKTDLTALLPVGLAAAGFAWVMWGDQVKAKKKKR